MGSMRRIVLLLSALLILAGCGAGGTELMHVHGLGYTADGKQLVVPAHDGLRIYENGRWANPPLPRHDYMGFTMTDDGFYSSGHPGTKEFRNPWGLVKSTDGGKSIKVLAFEGESDFHVMGAGYYSRAIYVFNPVANSRLVPGVHFTLDDGKTWQKSVLKGLTGSVYQITVHPTDHAVVAIASEDGLFLSTDHGHNFARVGAQGRATAAQFAPDGKRLYYGFQKLHVYDMDSRKATDLPVPDIGKEDAFGYIAINPVRADELAVATLQRSVYLSTDGGRAWRQIADTGKGR